jgi:hypothetical protein
VSHRASIASWVSVHEGLIADVLPAGAALPGVAARRDRLGPDGQQFAVLAFTVVGAHIAAIDVLADPDRLASLKMAP